MFNSNWLHFKCLHVAITHPMICPERHDKSGTKWTCRVHACASVLNLQRFLLFGWKIVGNFDNFIYTNLNELQFRLWLRLLTAAKWPAVIDNPMANGAEPLMSLRRSSQTPCTTKTSKNVIKASTTTPWIGSKAAFNEDNPKFPRKILSGVANYNDKMKHQ